MWKTWRAKLTKRSVLTILCLGITSTRQCGHYFWGGFWLLPQNPNTSTSDSTTSRPDPSSHFFARSFFHSQTLFSSIPYIWTAALLTWCWVFSSSLLWKLLVLVLVTPCLSTCNCRRVPLTIQNVIKCGVYLKEAAIFLYSSAGVVSIQGWPLNRLWHLFKQVQYILLCDMLFSWPF